MVFGQSPEIVDMDGLVGKVDLTAVSAQVLAEVTGGDDGISVIVIIHYRIEVETYAVVV